MSTVNGVLIFTVRIEYTDESDHLRPRSDKSDYFPVLERPLCTFLVWWDLCQLSKAA